MEAVGFWPGGKSDADVGVPVRYAQRDDSTPASKPRSVFVLPSQFDPESVNTLRRVMSRFVGNTE